MLENFYGKYAALSWFCSQQQVAGIDIFSFLCHLCVQDKGLNEARVWQLNSNACMEGQVTPEDLISSLKTLWLSFYRGCATYPVLGTTNELQ